MVILLFQAAIVDVTSVAKAVIFWETLFRQSTHHRHHLLKLQDQSSGLSPLGAVILTPRPVNLVLYVAN
jgi:hypothetical protein